MPRFRLGFHKRSPVHSFLWPLEQQCLHQLAGSSKVNSDISVNLPCHGCEAGKPVATSSPRAVEALWLVLLQLVLLILCCLAISGCTDEAKPDQSVVSTAASSSSLASTSIEADVPRDIEIVLLQDLIVALRAHGSAERTASGMRKINLDKVPSDFASAYRLHIGAWQAAAGATSAIERTEASAQIAATFAEIKTVTQRYGARLPEEILPADTGPVVTRSDGDDLDVRSDRPESGESAEDSRPVASSFRHRSWIPGSSSCTTSGLGPGNTAQCGELATSCTTTGLGPGNDAACGGLATGCTTTGLGAGNAAACGGLANSCTTTGLGAGNDAACGGQANSCTTTGLGPGNAAACGGLATSCTTTGLGSGNDAACGGLATSCTSTGLGVGNAAACGGLATSCESVGDKRVCGGRFR